MQSNVLESQNNRGFLIALIGHEELSAEEPALIDRLSLAARRVLEVLGAEHVKARYRRSQVG